MLAIILSGVAIPQANAVVKDFSCVKDGFTGYIRLSDTRTNVVVSYKINKGTNSGGNLANVLTFDNGTAPRTELVNNAARQDNVWHAMNANSPYRRGSGGFDASFTFDKSGARDPSCTAGGVV
ncbi:hypothetical protein [Kineosporia sp. A_224]|uniref:hypothetical protein n=1 Tax=Kineosporia sp. A_224 TaxID=1962180 RepID=UPI00117B2920|nr:hypothetical protein [Kineosporia sp. A_224]